MIDNNCSCCRLWSNAVAISILLYGLQLTHICSMTGPVHHSHSLKQTQGAGIYYKITACIFNHGFYILVIYFYMNGLKRTQAESVPSIHFYFGIYYKITACIFKVCMCALRNQTENEFGNIFVC